MKFRVWDKIQQKYLPALSDGFTFDTGLEYPVYQGIGEFIKFPQFQVEQWTGLTDKNGKDVYEGDIMEVPVNIAHQYEWEDRFEKLKCLVSFRDGVFAARWGHEGCNKEYPKDGVVIGNINENPQPLD